jgi:exopolysaccharide biosynthesis protein
MKTKKFPWVTLYCLLLCLFTVYVVLDTFVLVKTLSPEIGTPSATEQNGNEQTDSPFAPVITDSMYRDENILITVTEYRYEDSNVYVADMVLSSPEYLKTAFARGTFGRNIAEETSVTAEANGAILAINGDFYGSQEKCYVIRNGVLYRDTPAGSQKDLVIYKDGSAEIIQENKIKAAELMERGAYHVFSFGPPLVQDGEIAIPKRGLHSHTAVDNPRTAIGIMDALHYVFVTVDGRTKDSTGLTAMELAEFMISLGATTAYNLDGGGSATMYFNGKVINQPTYKGKDIEEREVSDIVYIGY